jgi:hypothetical protein
MVRAVSSATKYDEELKLQQASDPLSVVVPWALKNSRKGPIGLAREVFNLYRGPGRLLPYEYFWYQLYDDNKYSIEEKRRFVSESIYSRITHQCCDPKWDALTEDKWISYCFLEGKGFRVPQTCAVIDNSVRSFGTVRKISSPAQLKRFLSEFNSYPLFAKANLGVGSFGAFIIIGVDGDRILLEYSGNMTFDELFSNVIGARTFLLQTCVQNHSAIRAFTQHLATVRTVNLVMDDQVVTPFTLLKIPSSASIADNYWRPGNLIADLHADTGVIRRVVSGKGVHLKELTVHPETGHSLVGMALPYWRELRELNEACARLFAPVRYQSLDIAITQEGPLVIEVNKGSAFELAQFATGSGILTDSVRNFFEMCGYNFNCGFFCSLWSAIRQSLLGREG